MSSLKVKYLKGADQISPMDQLADALDSMSDSMYPIWGNAPNSSMPNLSEAIEMSNNRIYRINAPGYLFNCKSSASAAASSESAIIISSLAYTIDGLLLGVGKIAGEDDNRYWKYNESGRRYGSVVGAIDDEASAQTEAISSGIVNGPPPAADVTASKTYRPVCPLLKLTTASEGPDRTTYSVSVGNGSGGHVNQMIPIVPAGVDVCTDCGIAHAAVTYAATYPGYNEGKGAKSGYQGTTDTEGTFVVASPSADTNPPKWYFVPSHLGASVQLITNMRNTFVSNITPDKISKTYTLTDYMAVFSQTEILPTGVGHAKWKKFTVTSTMKQLAISYPGESGPLSDKFTDIFKRQSQMFSYNSGDVYGAGINQQYDMVKLLQPDAIDTVSGGDSNDECRKVVKNKFVERVVVDPRIHGPSTPMI